MTSRISASTNFPATTIAAGSGPVVQHQHVIGNEDLIGAITEKLGGKIPPGSTMKAEYDTDEKTGAILTTIENKPDSKHVQLFTFWRTFTVEVPGQGTYQFRKQIFTNLSVPLNGDMQEFQKSLELAAMASSAYSKICCDAILVKGGGQSKKGLDEEKVELIQKKTFVELGMKLSDLKGTKVSELRTIDAKVGTGTVTFDLKKVKPGKTTSFYTRHQKFIVENPPVKYVKEKVKYLTKLFDNSEELAKQYMDGGTSDEAKAFKDAHAERTKFPIVKEVNRSPAVTARKLCEGGQNPTVREAFVKYGADLKRGIAEIQSQRDYLSHDKPSLGWHIESLQKFKKGWRPEWVKLRNQQKILEEKLSQLQNDWPGLFEQINTEAASKVNASHPKAAIFKQEAKNLNVPHAHQAAFVAAKVDIEVAYSALNDLQGTLQTHQDQLAKIDEELANAPEPLKTDLQNQKNALDQLIDAENLKIEELTLIRDAATNEANAAQHPGTADAQQMLIDSGKARGEANAKNADPILKAAKAALKQSEKQVVATRAKIAEETAKAAADAKKAKFDAYMNSREAQDLAPSERAAYVNKKLEIDDQRKLVQAKRDEIKPSINQFDSDIAALQKEIEDPKTPGDLRDALNAEKAAIEALKDNTNKSLEIEVSNLAAKECELKMIMTKGSDPEFKNSGNVSQALDVEIKRHADEAKAKTANATALTKELKTDELTQKVQTAKENTVKAREQLKANIAEAEARWGAEINALPEGKNKADVKAIHEDFVEHNLEMTFLQKELLKSPQELAQLQTQINQADDPQIKAALETKLQALKDLSNAYEAQLNAETAIVMLARNTLLSMKKNNYVAEESKVKEYNEQRKLQIDAKAGALNARVLAEFTRDKFNKQAELLQKIKTTEANIAILEAKLAQKEAEYSDPNNKRNSKTIDEKRQALKKAIGDEKQHLESQKELAKVHADKLPRNDQNRGAWHNDWKKAVNESNRTKEVREATAKPLLKKIEDKKAQVDSEEEESWEDW